MNRLLLKSLLATGLSLAALDAALAAPVLRADVMVSSEIVTVGDMFDDAGIYAEEGLFRAPAPGTAGLVDVAAINTAVARIGLVEFSTQGLTSVRVARRGVVVDEPMLSSLIALDLSSRGILTGNMTAETAFDHPVSFLSAATQDEAAKLLTMRYMPDSGRFTARFLISGETKPLEVSGVIELMIEVPHLVANLAAGTVLSPADIEMRLVPLKFAESSGFAPLDQFIGKALQRPSRQGMMLKPADVAEPQLIARNQTVTVLLRSGPMTLTVSGQALNAASQGQPVAVLNDMSKQVVHGVALSSGTVEISAGPLNVAGL